jgi:lysozyme family protein
VGVNTLQAINASPPQEIFNKIKKARTDFYKLIIITNPKLGVFKKGWENRLNDYKFEV